MLDREFEDQLKDKVDVVECKATRTAASEMEVKVTKSPSVHSGLAGHCSLGPPVSGPSG